MREVQLFAHRARVFVRVPQVRGEGEGTLKQDCVQRPAGAQKLHVPAVVDQGHQRKLKPRTGGAVFPAAHQKHPAGQ